MRTDDHEPDWYDGWYSRWEDDDHDDHDIDWQCYSGTANGEWMLALYRDGFYRPQGTQAAWHHYPDLPSVDVISELL